MRLTKPIYTIVTPFNGLDILRLIEAAGRTCYKSEERISADSSVQFCRQIMVRGHCSVIEHASLTVRFIANRGFTHELVRHRLAAYSQESTRFCNYSGGVEFILPPQVSGIPPGEYVDATPPPCLDSAEEVWFRHMLMSERHYLALLECNWTPQEARGVLPIDLKTEIVMTANLREWRHVFNLRCSPAAHPQMRELMIPLRAEFQKGIPVLFDGP